VFTGIILLSGKVKTTAPRPGGMVLAVDLREIGDEIAIGDSIAVNGVCLTVSKIQKNIVYFDISQESLNKTNLAKITPGSAVNIEFALKADSRLGGHIVQGHIDEIAKIESVTKKGDFAEITFSCSDPLLDEIVPKGSIAVDGVSLTVASMSKTGFTIAAIPVTLKITTLKNAKPGMIVNIETDIVIKTVKKQLEKIMPQSRKLTVDKIRQLGF